MRCVEGWSMVIPWIGFPLARLLEQVQPTAEAKYVRLETVYAPDQMPGQSSRSFDWPYVEGLRLDEAMHDLTILATGLYGKPLDKQNGAPHSAGRPGSMVSRVSPVVRSWRVPVSLWMASSPTVPFTPTSPQCTALVGRRRPSGRVEIAAADRCSMAMRKSSCLYEGMLTECTVRLPYMAHNC